MVYGQDTKKTSKTIYIDEMRIPLTAISENINTLFGQVYKDGYGIPDITIQLIEQESLKIIDSTTTANDGTFVFRGFANGVYYIKIIAPEGVSIMNTDVLCNTFEGTYEMVSVI
ncbi:MAG: hypothetical protein FWG21_02170 [Oscillospiraceae bacterium]|nr:hypothetical protein [Oscillospiraceae bacterium]